MGHAHSLQQFSPGFICNQITRLYVCCCCCCRLHCRRAQASHHHRHGKKRCCMSLCWLLLPLLSHAVYRLFNRCRPTHNRTERRRMVEEEMLLLKCHHTPIQLEQRRMGADHCVLLERGRERGSAWESGRWNARRRKCTHTHTHVQRILCRALLDGVPDVVVPPGFHVSV